MIDSIISDYMRGIGAKGGKATAKKLTAKQRSLLATMRTHPTRHLAISP